MNVRYCLDSMTDTTTEKGVLWQARLNESLSREAVCRLLDPPVSTKTLERWERGSTPCPRWRLRQLASVYRTKVTALDQKVAA